MDLSPLSGDVPGDLREIVMGNLVFDPDKRTLCTVDSFLGKLDQHDEPVADPAALGALAEKAIQRVGSIEALLQR